MRSFDPSDGACDGDAGLIECRTCGEVYAPTEDWSDCPACHPEPGIDWDALLAAQRETQAPVASDAVPVRVDDVPTLKVRVMSDAELLDIHDQEARLSQHAAAGQGESAPITVPWPVAVRR